MSNGFAEVFSTVAQNIWDIPQGAAWSAQLGEQQQQREYDRWKRGEEVRAFRDAKERMQKDKQWNALLYAEVLNDPELSKHAKELPNPESTDQKEFTAAVAEIMERVKAEKKGQELTSAAARAASTSIAERRQIPQEQIPAAQPGYEGRGLSSLTEITGRQPTQADLPDITREATQRYGGRFTPQEFTEAVSPMLPGAPQTISPEKERELQVKEGELDVKRMTALRGGRGAGTPKEPDVVKGLEDKVKYLNQNRKDLLKQAASMSTNQEQVPTILKEANKIQKQVDALEKTIAEEQKRRGVQITSKEDIDRDARIQDQTEEIAVQIEQKTQAGGSSTIDPNMRITSEIYELAKQNGVQMSFGGIQQAIAGGYDIREIIKAILEDSTATQRQPQAMQSPVVNRRITKTSRPIGM
jgi:hypothetical protein